MKFDHPVVQSKAWYEFVSKHGANDPELKRQVLRFLDARAKVNERLIELAKSVPNLKLEVERLSKVDSLSDNSFFEDAKKYLDLHSSDAKTENATQSADISIKSLIEDAKNNGIDIVNFSVSSD